MYYYIIYNSSIIDKGDDGKKYLTTLLYGSISYILTHAYLSSSSSKVVQSIKDYFDRNPNLQVSQLAAHLGLEIQELKDILQTPNVIQGKDQAGA